MATAAKGRYFQIFRKREGVRYAAFNDYIGIVVTVCTHPPFIINSGIGMFRIRHMMTADLHKRLTEYL